MAKRPLPSPEVLRQLLHYEPETGKLFWKERALEHAAGKRHQRRWNTMFAGSEALTATKLGYKAGKVLDVQVLGHRVAWAIWHGEWPAGQIDHIDGDRSNNRLENLRVVTTTENMRNAARPSNNRSGVTGVYFHQCRSRWVATIRLGEKRVFLGAFSEISDAISARKAGEQKYGFHPNHGREGVYR